MAVELGRGAILVNEEIRDSNAVQLATDDHTLTNASHTHTIGIVNHSNGIRNVNYSLFNNCLYSSPLDCLFNSGDVLAWCAAAPNWIAAQ